ncbi:DUF4129 domain-containing protein [Saccharothrix syringae]|uniref:DUF4129 domain-containing protein n=1 Tax=Saccharothrix syringae TaxID=103733 RepID=A0A5Q0GT70_SACSY|nr:DUF4129 domain-containing protein [Saccharothrix syringae]QFZ16670.1 DUF4129 domain-containing protein [Saccharothrix syringae]
MRPRLALALATGSALILVALAARGSSPVTYTDRTAALDDAPPPTASSVEPLNTDVEGSTAAGSLLVFVIVLFAAAIIGAIALAVYIATEVRRRRRSGTGRFSEAPDAVDEHARPPEVLVQRATEALRVLRERANGPPGDAVIAAWLALEQAAEDSGQPRQGHQTPTEFTGALLARYRVDGDATTTLRRTYQRARFGTAEVTPADARVAAEALETIVRGLR